MTLVGTYGTARVEQVMGMPIIVDVRDADPHGSAVNDVFAWLRHVDETFSTYQETSAISRLNRGELELDSIPGEVNEILHRCEELRIETGGFFDVHASSPQVTDPSGLVKGWSVDRGADLLTAAGLSNFAIYAGGDIRARGGALPEKHWRIGVQHPRERNEVVATVESDDLAIATSGTYARGEHILDPHTRAAPAGLLSVTITGPDLGTADAYATAAFAMGADGVEWLRQLPALGYEGLAITEAEAVFSTPGFPSEAVAAA